MSDVARICSIITFDLSKLWKVKFSILCDVIFLVRLQGNFDIDHSWEWKGSRIRLLRLHEPRPWWSAVVTGECTFCGVWGAAASEFLSASCSSGVTWTGKTGSTSLLMPHGVSGTTGTPIYREEKLEHCKCMDYHVMYHHRHHHNNNYYY